MGPKDLNDNEANKNTGIRRVSLLGSGEKAAGSPVNIPVNNGVFKPDLTSGGVRPVSPSRGKKSIRPVSVSSSAPKSLNTKTSSAGEKVGIRQKPKISNGKSSGSPVNSGKPFSGSADFYEKLKKGFSKFTSNVKAFSADLKQKKAEKRKLAAKAEMVRRSNEASPNSYSSGTQPKTQARRPAAALPMASRKTGRPAGSSGRRKQDFLDIHPEINRSSLPTGRSAENSPKLKKDLNNIRNELRRHTRGKPTRGVKMLTVPGMIGKGIGVVIKVLILVIVMAVLFVGGTGVGVLMGYISTTEPVEIKALSGGSLTSYVYDASGGLMAKYTGYQNIDRKDVAFKDVKDTYIDEAFIAIEDVRFYNNIGIDPKRILSAVVSALANGGVPQHGGSTITQQTVKLATGDNESSAQRKVQEWYRAILLTQELTKEEIMGTYLNLVPMGNSYVGIESAAQGYFGKHASELNLLECSFLAGIPRGPSIYNPRTESGMRNLLRRQRQVLASMYTNGFISEAQYREALNSEIKITDHAPSVAGTSIKSYYTEYAIDQVIEDLMTQKELSYNAASHMVQSGGLHIYTAMEPSVQASIDRVFNDPGYYYPDPDEYSDSPYKPELGQVIINNETGTIAGMGGGVGKKKANLVLNRAVDLERQPGSAIKPIGVYAPGFDMQLMTGGTIFMDKPQALDPDNPDVIWPQNVDERFLGPVAARFAIKDSRNVPAVLAMKLVTPERSLEYLNNMGINRLNDPVGLSLALGGLQHGLSPLEVAQAYMTLATGGLHTRPMAYTKVVNSDGEIVLESHPNWEKVFSPEAAYMATSILKETFLPGTSAFPYSGLAYDLINSVYNANGESIATCAKSGTTDDHRDHWFCGYTPYYSTAVWVGRDNNGLLNFPSESYRIPEHVFEATMTEIHADKEAKDFPVPGNIVSLQICSVSGQLATNACGGNIYTEVFDVNSPVTPTASCSVHGRRQPAQTTKPSASQAASEPAPTTSQTPAPAG